MGYRYAWVPNVIIGVYIGTLSVLCVSILALTSPRPTGCRRCSARNARVQAL